MGNGEGSGLKKMDLEREEKEESGELVRLMDNLGMGIMEKWV